MATFSSPKLTHLLGPRAALSRVRSRASAWFQHERARHCPLSVPVFLSFLSREATSGRLVSCPGSLPSRLWVRTKGSARGPSISVSRGAGWVTAQGQAVGRSEQLRAPRGHLRGRVAQRPGCPCVASLLLAQCTAGSAGSQWVAVQHTRSHGVRLGATL